MVHDIVLSAAPALSDVEGKDLHAQSSAFEKSRKAGPDWEPAFSAHVNGPATSGHGPGVIGPPIASVPASGSQYCEPSSRVAMW